MAREKKGVELRTVDDLVKEQVPAIRLETKDTLERGEIVRLSVPAEEGKLNPQLEDSIQQDFEIRTHQPGIEALIDHSTLGVETLEQDWGKETTEQRSVPWGWLALAGIFLISGAIWSLTQLQKAKPVAEKIEFSTKSVMDKEADEDLEASKLIDKIESITSKFFAASSPDILASYSRDYERVLPLIRQYYSEKPLEPHLLTRTNFLKPLTLDNRADFWMQSVQLDKRTSCNIIIEIDGDGEPKIDWETMVCYQPMEWDTFALTRPTGTSLDFRVYVEKDVFFSHEFADSNLWNCFRLTTLNSEETLFGYAKIDSPVSNEILTILEKNNGKRISVILRVSIPEGIQSRRGVIIEKVVSPRWIYVDSPNPRP